jgi:hypothetical protein
MRAILLNSIVAGLVGGAAWGCTTAPPDPAAELAEMQDRLLRAVLEGRRDEYASMLHDDWRVTHVDGRVRTKAQVLQDVFGGEAPVLSGAVEDLDVRVYGDAAVMTGRSSWTARNGESLELRFTDTAIRRGGTWLIVASHATALEH